MQIKTYFVLGLTCSGKDYFIEQCVAQRPDIFGAVQVGKEFRKRYPPEHFKGQGAPQHTEDEAFDIFYEQWTTAKKNGSKIILVSGQPRRPSQVLRILNVTWGDAFWLHTNEEILLTRLEARFANDPESLKLSKERITNDKIMYYETLFELLSNGVKIIPVTPKELPQIIYNLIKMGET